MASTTHPFRRTGEVTQSLTARANEHRSFAERIADRMTRTIGSISFFVASIVAVVSWIVLNSGLIPGLEPFDPYPFGLLTMTVSLAGLLLPVLVLMSQNRAAKIADLREEVDLQVDVITEQELTKLLELMVLLLEQHGVDLSHDRTLQAMLRPLDPSHLEHQLEAEHDA